MRVSLLATREVATIDAAASIALAARTMRNQHAGALVVTSEGQDPPRPIGIITDRDIVVSVVAVGLDPSAITAGDIMAEQLYVAGQGDDAFSTIRQMRLLGVRRAPIVDDTGKLMGIFTVDDFIAYLGREINEVSSLIAAEQLDEQTTRLAYE